MQVMWWRKLIIGIFPEFYNEALTLAMQTHSMEMLIKAANYAYPGQIAVCTVDCPIYALQKMSVDLSR